MKEPMRALAEDLRDFEESRMLSERKPGYLPMNPPPPLPSEKGLLAQILGRIVALIAAGGLIATGGSLKACSKGLAEEGGALFRNGAARVMETEIGQSFNRTIERVWKSVVGGFFHRAEMRMELPPINVGAKRKTQTSSDVILPLKTNISRLLSIYKTKKEDCPSLVDILVFKLRCKYNSPHPNVSRARVEKYCTQEARKRFPCATQ